MMTTTTLYNKWDAKQPRPAKYSGDASLVLQFRTVEHHVSQDAARRQARLAVILENLEKDICYTHGEMCQTRADCWAREIIAREPAWS